MSGLKTGVENDLFGSEIGSGFREPRGTPPPRITRSTPPGNETALSFSNILIMRAMGEESGNLESSLGIKLSSFMYERENSEQMRFVKSL